jgi:hypothetical protein
VLRRWYFLCVSDAITHDLLSPCPGRPFCTSEKSRIQRRSVTAYSIRRAIGSGDSDIRDILGGDIQVHIVATSVKADETVLDLAGTDKTTFIVSNDRFAEFGEKPALRDQRVIRHEIVSGQVLIHDLGVSETFIQ